jgi:DNA-binding SARP family transcriptional activator/tetratricopeptide (TPR) repeat protein
MEFRLLGPVEVWHGGVRLRLGGPKPRGLLAVLLLEYGRVVSLDRLIDLLWGESPPPRAPGVVQQYVSTLRASFQAAVPDRAVIVTSGRGYAVHIEPAELDLAVFAAGVAAGRAELRAGRANAAAAQLRAALDLWRGTPLAGAALATDAEEARLREEWEAAVEDRIEADLACGLAGSLVPELTGLVRAHPLRERLRGQLMRALVATGRHGEAVNLYHDGRRTLADELGIDPGPGLQRLYESILRSAAPTEPVPDAPPRVAESRRSPRPSLLPSDIADFTGLDDDVARIADALTAGQRPGATAVPVVAIAGRPGTGKTTLAVHVAHRLAGDFPDGQLFATLRGSTANRVDTASQCTLFLRALGMDPGEIAETIAERAEQLRLLLSGRRVLMVLDDAAAAEQVRPLLPGEPSCAVVVTSRTRITGLAGATLVELDNWQAAEATTLLGRIVGTDRLAADPDAGHRIVELCGGLPLAVRVAGARLAARPHWPVGRLADRLADERRRLDELSYGDLEVRGSLALSYGALSDDGRRALRWLTLLDAPSVAAWVVAAQLGCPVKHAEDVVDELVDVRLLDPVGADLAGQERFQCHDLVRLFGRERAEAEDEPEVRRAAVAAAASAWLQVVKAATAELPRAMPRLVTVEIPLPLDPEAVRDLMGQPAAWLESESAALVAAVETAAAHELDQLACELAQALLSSHFAVLNAFDSWWRTHQAAMHAADRAGNPLGRAVVHTGLGFLRHKQDRFSEARRHLVAALAAFEELGHRPGVAVARYGVGSVHFEVAEYPEALRDLSVAAALFTELGDGDSAAYARYLIGAAHRDLGDFEAARYHLGTALALYRDLANRRGQALCHRGIGLIHRARGEPAEALRLSEEAGRMLAEIGDRLLCAYAAQSSAKALLRLGRRAEAADLLTPALAVCEAHLDRFGCALMLRTLGEVHLAEGDLDAAADALKQSLGIWRTLGLPLWQARTLRDLGAVHARAGNHPEAHESWSEAEAIFSAVGARERDEMADWRAQHGGRRPG